MTLAEYRDLLLPGLWGMKVKADLFVDYKNDELHLVTKSGRHRLFTRAELEDRNLLQSEFRARVTALLGKSS